MGEGVDEPAGQRRTSPPLRKARDYKKQRRGYAEYPHGFRKTWPRKEAKLERAHRHSVRQELAALPVDQPSQERESLEPELTRRKTARKWSSGTPLSSWVDGRLRNRTYRTAWNFFRRGYRGERDRAAFIAFLSMLIEGRSQHAKELARHFGCLLEPPYQLTRESVYLGFRATPFLQSFFKDEPGWELRLRTWIERLLHEPPYGSR